MVFGVVPVPWGFLSSALGESAPSAAAKRHRRTPAPRLVQSVENGGQPTARHRRSTDQQVREHQTDLSTRAQCCPRAYIQAETALSNELVR